MAKGKMVLSQDMQELIRKALPEHVNTTLRGELEKGEKAAEQVEELLRDLNITRDMLDDAKKQIVEQEAFEAAKENLMERENELAVREAGFKEAELQYKLEAEQRLNAQLQSTLAGLVRNTEWRKDVMMMTDTVYNDNGMSSMRSVPGDTVTRAE